MLFEIILVIIHLVPYLFLFSISLDVFFLTSVNFPRFPKIQTAIPHVHSYPEWTERHLRRIFIGLNQVNHH